MPRHDVVRCPLTKCQYSLMGSWGDASDRSMSAVQPGAHEHGAIKQNLNN